MFKVFVIEDIVTLSVSEYVGDKRNILFQKLSNKYINKVIHGVGLAIALDGDFLKCESRILPNDGSAHYTLIFKLLVFSPVINEVFKANVILYNKNFIKLSIGFFSDLHIIPNSLPEIYKYDETNGYWLKIDGDADVPIKTDNLVEFKILDIIYNHEAEDDGISTGMELLPILLVIGTIV
ncbi:hypothetical protein MACJ_001257 [Theileria orientalis]|uniref:RNA polymerase III subunit Rpc25 domain-containing protein n=1 Tax=Theileria orientalis TaxID=68886 RepID=A0A976QTL0_THEOR|nr:hypothetical protein MACJ_001257 [Theileria orientalis]